MTPEGKIKFSIRSFLDSINCWYYMPMPMGYGRNGIPDFVGCLKSHFFSIEAKKPGGKQTPWQKREQEDIERAGGTYWLIDSAEKLEDFRAWTHVIQRSA